MSDEWINFEDGMPPLKKTIEILYDEKILEACFASYGSNSFSLYSSDEETQSFILDMRYVKGWRPLKEKRPDFSKLREGDILVVEFDEGKLWGGNFFGMNETYDRIKLGYGIDHKMSAIKKITRINMKEQKFEEI